MIIRNQAYEEGRRNEALRAENYRLRALLEYVAIMADVELPEEEEGEHE